MIALCAAILCGFGLSACNRAEVQSSCAAGLPGWQKPSDGIGHLMSYNRVTIEADGGIRWNDEQISKSKLAELMMQSGELTPAPQIFLQISPNAKCAGVVTVRNVMNSAPICRDMRLCGEGFGWIAKSDVGNLHRQKLDF